jgi:hypothetical protein
MTLNVLLLADEHFTVKGKNGAEYTLSQVNRNENLKTKTFFAVDELIITSSECIFAFSHFLT